MNGNRRRRAGARGKIAALIAAALSVALVILLLAWLVRGATRLLGGGNAGERDPQFAEQAQGVTRPPELSGENGAPPDESDPSALWDPGAQTPVDKTAEQLSREAESGL